MERSLRVFNALYRSAAREYFRDFLAAFFSFAFPMIFLVIFGLFASNQRTPVLSVGVVDLSGESQSAAVIEALADMKFVGIEPTTREEGLEQMRAGSLGAFVVFPSGFGGATGVAAELYVDEGSNVFARAALDAAQSVVTLDQLGVTNAFQYETKEIPVDTGSFLRFIVPGLVALALLQLGLLGTATPLLTARDRGTLRHLSITPAAPSLILASQVLLRVTTGVIQVVLLLSAAYFFFGVKIGGSWFALGLVCLVGGAMLISIGYALAGVMPNLSSGIAIILLVNFVMMFFGGIFVDLSGFIILHLISLLMPVSYLADSLRQVITGNEGTLSLGANLLMMVFFGGIAAIVATRKFRYDMEP